MEKTKRQKTIRENLEMGVFIIDNSEKEVFTE